MTHQINRSHRTLSSTYTHSLNQRPFASARSLVSNVDRRTPAQLASEDFAYFLQKRPGAFFFLGNGNSAPLHSPDYDFNDQIIATGVEFWCRLIRAAT
ncbi:M20/M25/M40 family metallo-hydrolase [Agrobacterium sp. AGB01]|nr:M20/M25/M40 family metallo-hydrolase [Agrobacterium sp. AGB01]